MTLLFASLVVALICFVLLVVYVLRVLLRIVALRAAVAFLQADGTEGEASTIARRMFTYLVRGR